MLHTEHKTGIPIFAYYAEFGEREHSTSRVAQQLQECYIQSCTNHG
jgi:hypothetical protein